MKEFFSILFIFISLVNYSQQIVTGTIRDKNNIPIFGVKVRTLHSDINTFSNTEGNYSLEIQNNETYLEFSKASYRTQIIEITNDTINLIMLSDTIKDIFDLSLNQLMSIKVISATKSEQKISSAPAIISVITSEQIHQRGYRTVGEAIQSLPGIDVLSDHYQYNAGLRGVNAGMRGASRIVKIMIDGQPVSNRSSTENYLGEELIPITAIDRIEVIRGPSSALYGANAFLGVIHIITKKGKEINGTQIQGQLGSITGNPAYGGNLIVGKKIKNIDFIFSANHSYFDRSGLAVKNLPNKYLYNKDSISKNDISKPQCIFTKINYKSKKTGILGFDFNFQHLDKHGEFLDWAPLSHKNHISNDNWYTRFTHEKAYNNKISSHFSTAYSKGNPTKYEKLAINQLGLSDWVTRKVGYKALDINSDITYSFNQKSNIKAGIEYINELQDLQTYYYNFQNREPIPSGTELGDTIFINKNVFIQFINYPFQKKRSKNISNLGFTSGISYGVHNIYGNVLNYRIAIVYPFSQKIFCKLLYGTSFKAPASTQLYTTLLVPGDVIGNPNLKPEKAQTTEFLIGTEFLKYFDIQCNVFYNKINDIVELVKESTNVKASNINKTESFGLESEIVYKNNNFYSYLNYSYQKSSLIKNEGLANSKIVPTRLFPAHMTKFGINISMPKIFLNINTEGEYIGKRIASEQNIFSNDPVYRKDYSLDPYFLLNMTITSQNIKVIGKNETIISLKIVNILNTKYYFPGYRNFDIPGFGRSFMFTLTQNIY